MEGSNYSGGSYPPALYDTSVSSASASWRNASPLQGSYSERDDPQFNQYQNDYHQQQRGHTMYSRSPRSFDNSRYKYNRDVTAMSDPGGSMPEQNFQHRSHVEYAQSEIGSPSTRYYEPQQRSPRRYYEEDRHREANHQYLQNQYSSAPSPRRKSISPPLEQQRSESPMLQPMFSDDGEIIRDNYGRGNEGHHDDMYKASPSYNRRSLDSSNIKEMQRQLWNDKRRDPSPPKYDNRRIQQSLSPERRRQQSAPPSTNISRYARSLSPRRRQYQQSSPMAKESPSGIRKVSSTMSDTSYNNRFNSKFVAAALEAQKRGDNDNEVEEPQRHHLSQYQQQREHRNQSLSSRPLNESDSKQHRFIPASSPMHYSSNQNGDAHRKVSQYHRGNDTYVNTSTSTRSSEIRQRPTIPPSPSSSSSPSVTNTGRQDRHQRKHYVPGERGRSSDSPQLRKNDLSARRIRPPSPLLLDRIKSYDHEYYNDSTRAVSDDRVQSYERGRHDHHPVPNDGWRGTNYHDNDNNKNGNQVVDRNNMRSNYIANEEDMQRLHRGAYQNERINLQKSYSNELSSPSVNRQNSMNGGSHSKFQQIEMKGSRDMAGEIEKDRMASLVDKLSAVNRANPQSALAQIDSILREESRSSHSQSYGNSNDVDNTKDAKLQQNHPNYPESNLGEREFEDNGEDDNNDEEDDDSSDVSSITNPTFQPGTSNSKYAKNVDSFYIQGDDRYNMHSTAPNNNIGFNPSTSSFRRPRPSHLQNYSNDASRDPNTMSRSEWKRQQLQTFPPPSTIKVKDDQGSNEGPLQDSADVRERMLQKNMKIEASRSNESRNVSRQPDKVEAFRANNNNTVSRAPEKPRIKQDKPKKKLDRFIDNKQELAEKIRGWDELSNQELSNQMSSSRSEQEANKEVRQNIAAFSKPHPWDSANVQTKDTSMENADGVEASISTRTHAFGSYMRELDVEAEISVGGSRAPSKTQPNYFANARRNIKDKSGTSRGTNPFADESVESNEKQTHARNRFPDFPDPEFPDLDQVASNEIPNVEVSMNGIPQFNPSGQQQYRSSNRDEKKSNGEGSSWVEMPPSSFFPDVNELDFVPITASKPSRKPSVASSPRVTSGGQRKIQDVNDDLDDDPRAIARLACKTVAPKEPKVKEKKRGKLNFFMKKKKTNPRSVGYTASASGGSMSGMSVSLESRGVKSASHVPSSSRPMPQSSFQILAPPPGVSAVVKNAPRGRPGQQNSSSTTRRGRSKSSEKFRSSNMAKKFNRVMQLYDDDDY